MSKRDVVVLGAARSAIGTFGGSLADIEPAELAGTVMKEAIKRSGVDPKAINYVTVGNTIPTESRFPYVARVASIQAGLPMDSVAMSVNRLCSSGLQGIVTTAQNILLGDCDYGIGGGVEVMSRGGYLSHGHAHRRAHGRHQADRHDGRDADRSVRRRPHGHHRREPVHQVGHHPRAAGCAGGRIAPPCRSRDRRGALQEPDRADRQADQEGRSHVRHRRAREAGDDDGDACQDEAGVQEGRLGDRRQRLGHQRRRSLLRACRCGGGRCRRPQADGTPGVLRCRRRAQRDHGRGPDPGVEAGA